jgi:hypothetical protein
VQQSIVMICAFGGECSRDELPDLIYFDLKQRAPLLIEPLVIGRIAHL